MLIWLYLLVSIVFGLVSLYVAVYNIDCFFQNHRIRILVKLLGRTGVRISYFLVGVLFLAMGGWFFVIIFS